MLRLLRAAPVALILCFALHLNALPAGAFSLQEKRAKTNKTKTEEPEADAEAAQQRAVAISLVTALADEARSFKDQTRRARVQARAADVLWETDPERARELFRRAWEAAEVVDAETARQQSEEIQRATGSGRPSFIRGRPDLRSEVLRLVVKRDRKLGEEFLKALDEANEKARAEADADRRRNNPDLLGGSKRLQVARRLIEDGQVERALEFAAPALNNVNVDSIFFLSALREKNAQLADNAFATLLGLVARDATSDANTVSGLSSYLFTPFLYVTFESNGGGNQNVQRRGVPPANVDPGLRSNFLKLAFQILMQPSPAPDQDRTTAGRTGKFLVIKRLLPIFDQYSPDLSQSLRTQMTALASFVPDSFQQGENRAVTVGIVPDSEAAGDPWQRMQERLDRAKTSEDRDMIYADYAVALAGDGDPRVRDLVDKIEDTELRKNVKAYTDFELTQRAIRQKDATEAVRLVKTGDLTSVQKVWALTSAAKLVVAPERSRALDLLEQALAEGRRISASDPDRARALTAVAVGFAELDPVRAWETLGEIVKAANGAEAFTGEDMRISSRVSTKQMTMMTNSIAEDFDLLALFRPLARADLLRAIQVAKTFSDESPRAVATLAIARSVLEAKK